MRRLVFAVCLLTAGCASFSDESKEQAELHMRIGTAHFDKREYAMALKSLLEAERLDPKNPLVHNNLGLTYFMREKYDLAERSLRRALSLKSDYSDARNNLARVLIEKKEYAVAEKELQTVFQDLTYVGAARAWTNFGLSRFHQKDWTGARDAFAKALAEHREDCISQTYYGRSLFELEDYRRAAEGLDRAINFCQRQSYDEPHYFSALAWYRSGDRDRAMARFEQITKLYSDGKYREKARAMLELLRKGQDETHR